MFQTDWIVALQSHAEPFWTRLMLGVTTLGHREFFIPLLIVLLFAIDFRRGAALLQLLIWTLFITVALKQICALPRPYQVDAAVIQLAAESPEASTPFVARDAAGFWDPLPTDVVAYFRQRGAEEAVDWGFPSGHASGAVALWGGLALLFPRRRPLAVLAVVLIGLIPLSRAYLGLHFLADLLGGLALGAALLGLFGHVVAPRVCGPAQPLSRMGGVALVVAPWLAIPFVPLKDVATLAGIGVGVVAVAAQGWPQMGGVLWTRGARVLLAMALFVTMTLAAKRLTAPLPVLPAAVIEGAVPAGLLVWGGTWCCRRLGLGLQPAD